MNARRTGWLGRIAPHSKAGQVRLGLMLMILVGLAGAIRLDRVARALWADKQEGDLVFQSLPRGPLVDAIEGVTGSEWATGGRGHEAGFKPGTENLELLPPWPPRGSPAHWRPHER